MENMFMQAAVNEIALNDRWACFVEPMLKL